MKLREVLAPNGSAMTGAGTTSHLLGEGLVTLIDPGPDDPAHLAAILASLCPDEKIEAILVTHPHLDHSELAPKLAKITGAKTYGFGPAGSARSAIMQKLSQEGLTGGEGVDRAFVPDILVKDGQKLALSCGTLEVLHTPGHMAEHISFAIGDQLFCGDLIMAWAPSLISPPDGDMGQYFASLSKIAARSWRLLHPTHGAPITKPAERIAELTAHRRQREAQILAVLAEGAQSLQSLTQKVYAQIEPALIPAAQRNALAHLIELSDRGFIEHEPKPLTQARYSLKRLETSGA